MRPHFNSWKSLAQESRDYLIIYAWGLLWVVVYFFFPPTTTLSILNVGLLAAWTGASAVGAAIAMWGMLTKDNLLVERFGVTLLMVAPIVYTSTQLGLLVYSLFDPSILSPTGHWYDRLYLVVLGFWPFWFLNKRRRQLTRQVTLAKNTPLAGEND